MDITDLKYNRILNLLFVSKIKQAEIRNAIGVSKQNFRINLIDYVKSQLHLNVITRFYPERNIFDYYKALVFLEKGEIEYKKYTEKMVRYFYEDMGLFALNNVAPVMIDLIIDPKLELEEEVVDYKEVYDKVRHLMEISMDSTCCLDASKFEEIRKIIENFKYATFLDKISKVYKLEDNKNKKWYIKFSNEEMIHNLLHWIIYDPDSYDDIKYIKIINKENSNGI